MKGIFENRKDDNLRADAVGYLGKVYSPTTLRVLVRAALEDNSSKVRRRALWALDGIGDPAVVPVLIEAFEDEDIEIRLQAVEIADGLADPVTVPALIGKLKDEDPEVCQKAAEALATIGPPAKAAVPELIDLVNAWDKEMAFWEKSRRHDVNRGVHAAAVEALGAIGDAAAIPTLIAVIQHKMDPMTFKGQRPGYVMSQVKYSSVSDTAAQILGELRHPATIPLLKEAMLRSTFANSRIGILGQIGTPEAIEALDEVLLAWMLYLVREDKVIRNYQTNTAWRLLIGLPKESRAKAAVQAWKAQEK